MNKTFSTFAKGIATGMAVGTAVGMVARPMNIRKRSKIKKTASRALNAVGEVITSAQDFMR